jgi:hypothetical protein
MLLPRVIHGNLVAPHHTAGQRGRPNFCYDCGALDCHVWTAMIDKISRGERAALGS